MDSSSLNARRCLGQAQPMLYNRGVWILINVASNQWKLFAVTCAIFTDDVMRDRQMDGRALPVRGVAYGGVRCLFVCLLHFLWRRNDKK